jgi:transcription antitermination factor NusG
MKPIQKKKPEAPTSNRWKIVRGDLVEVINGPQSGQRGKVKDVLRKMNRIVVDGVNMVSMYSDISLGSSKYSVFLATASCETSFIGNARQESD